MTCMLGISQCISVRHALEQTHPDARTALVYDTPFQFVVAAILSAQCTDARVNDATSLLFEKFKSADDFARLTDSELIPYIRQCGLYRNKSQNIRACAKMLIGRFGGVIPCTREELMSLPGVGRKTANVILATIHSIPAVAVDTHVFRVARRIGLSDGQSPDAVERDLVESFPQDTWISLHHQLIWHGRRICRARNPLCPLCAINPWCLYARRNTLPA